MTERQDLVVIGAGPGGFAAAMRGAQLGGTVTLIEQAAYGGNCMHRACIPTKCLTAVTQRMMAIHEARSLGIQVDDPRADLDAVHRHKDRLIDGLRMGTEQLLRQRGINLIQGRAKLVGPNVVQVNGQHIRAQTIILATGSVSARPPIEGVDLPGVIGAGEAEEQAIELRQIPPRLTILGSEPWDVELAQYFHTLGSEVTFIEQGPQLLPEADREIAQRLGKVLHEAGIVLHRGIEVTAIRASSFTFQEARSFLEGSETPLVVALSDGQTVVADRVIAARRLPNSIGLGVRELGLATEHGALRVNERLQTHIPHIYAVGDVAAPPWGDHAVAGSHRARAEGIVAAENAMGLDSTLQSTAIPFGLYTWPEVAWVGLSEEQAEAAGIEYRVGRAPLAINPYALILGQTAGVVKIVAGKYGKILGAHVIAPGAIDLIHAVAVAMLSEATIHELMRLAPVHPAIGEALVDAAMDVEKRSLHLLT